MPRLRPPASGSFACHHLVTADPPAFAFYERLFGWTVREIREAGSLGATTFRSGDVGVATAGAIGGARADSRWLPCLAVDDPEAVGAAAEGIGAKIERSPIDSAGGGMVVVDDPAGARFCLTTSNPACAPGAEAAAPGRICWTELATGDPDKSAAFYRELIGWTSVERHRGREGRYWVFRHGGRDVAGMAQDEGATRPSTWVPYVQVVSAEDTAALAQDLGGVLVTPPGDVPGRGRYAVLRDPGGALVAVFALTEAA